MKGEKKKKKKKKKKRRPTKLIQKIQGQIKLMKTKNTKMKVPP